jgi:hypothetical protein
LNQTEQQTKVGLVRITYPSAIWLSLSDLEGRIKNLHALALLALIIDDGQDSDDLYTAVERRYALGSRSVDVRRIRLNSPLDIVVWLGVISGSTGSLFAIVNKCTDMRTKLAKGAGDRAASRTAVSLEGLKYEVTLARAPLLDVSHGKLSASRSLERIEQGRTSEDVKDRWRRQHTYGVVRLEAMISDAGSCLMETESIEPFPESETLN